MRSIGKEYEEKALKYLENKGYKIIDKNFYIKGGEIDIIAQKNNWTIFIEVKGRGNNSFGSPSQSVNFIKQKRIIKTALFYLKKNYIKMENIRFDVISIYKSGDKEEIEHIENAFSVQGYY